MSRLIVLSNRVKMPDNNPMAGGLAVALQDMLKDDAGIWMGWNGDIVETAMSPEFTSYCATNAFGDGKQMTLPNPNLNNAGAKITYVTTALSVEQYRHFYCGFSNNVLWPMLHEQPDLISQAPDDYAGYQAVNRLFAEQLKKIIQPNDVIWVHDYHFLSVAYYCRQLGLKNRIGFFLHIPFAPLAYWQQLDKSAMLIQHLAHYDVLGTQTQHDKANSLKVFEHYLKGCLIDNRFLENPFLKSRSFDNSRLDSSHLNSSHLNSSGLNNKPTQDATWMTSPKSPRFVELNKSARVLLRFDLDLNEVSDLDDLGDFDTLHSLAIDAYPIGVNVAKIQQQVRHLSLQSAKFAPKNETIKPARQQIIAVDRIDYSKGLLQRFSAYRHFLQQHPTYQHQLQFLQVACPSRLDLGVYQRLYSSVKHAVTAVNQQFLSSKSVTADYQTDALIVDDFTLGNLKDHPNSTHWQAITYSEAVLNHDTLMTAFWHSDVGWVNSLKDGMNLVAKEYIAAQNPDNPGVLVLSCYAGASEQMQAAVIIDPLQPDSVVQGLQTALTMPLAERKSRYQTLLNGLQQNDLNGWRQDFLTDLYGSDKDDCKHELSHRVYQNV